MAIMTKVSLFTSLFRKLILVIKIMLFLFILILILTSLSGVLRKKTSTTIRWDNFYEKAEQENIELLFLGSSQSFRGLNPRIIEEKLNLSSYNMSNSAQVISQTYYNLVEVLKYTKPKMVILETYYLDKSDLIPDRWYFAYEEVASMKLGTNKLEYIFDLFTWNTYINALFPSIREHENWKHIDTLYDNMKYETTGLTIYDQDMIDGYIVDETVLSSDNIQKYEELGYHKQDVTIDSKDELYIKKIVELCKDNNIEIMFIKTPMPKEHNEKTNYLDRYNEALRIANKYQVPYIDFNTIYDEVGFTSDDFRDEFSEVNHHLNVNGANKTSNYLVDYISDHYEDIPSKEDRLVDNTDTLIGFLRSMQNHQLAIISAKDEASTGITEEIVRGMQTLGLKTDLRGKFRYSYIAVFSPGTGENIEVLNEKKSMLNLEKGAQLGNIIIPVNIDIISAGFGSGSESSIKINHHEYSRNARGLNIVIYDLIDKKVVESKSFDTFLQSE